MRKLLSTLFILSLLLIFLAAAALIFIPDRVEQVWGQAGLPREPLDRALALSGRAPLAPSDSLRLYGVFEADTTHAMSELSGRATAVLVEEGEMVEAGEPLVTLDPTQVQAEIVAAEEAVASARAARDAVASGPSESAIAVADSAVAGAETKLANAQRTLAQAQSDLEDPQAITTQIDRTRALIPAARAAIDRAKASVSQADVLLQQARTDGSREGQFQQQIYAKQKAAAEAEVEAAQARLKGLQRTLTLLQAMKKNPLALQAQVRQAEQGVKLAEAELSVARAQRQQTAAPPSDEAVAVADAGVQKAEAALALARWKSEHLTVSAPASGRVQHRMVEPGETVGPGAVLFTIADVDEMVVRVYVAEQDLHRIQVGEKVTVETPLLPGRQLQATVSYIAPEAQFRPNNVLNPDDRGDMVFLVKLRLPNNDGALKPGMPADVFLPEG